MGPNVLGTQINVQSRALPNCDQNELTCWKQRLTLAWLMIKKSMHTMSTRRFMSRAELIQFEVKMDPLDFKMKVFEQSRIHWIGVQKWTCVIWTKVLEAEPSLRSKTHRHFLEIKVFKQSQSRLICDQKWTCPALEERFYHSIFLNGP